MTKRSMSKRIIASSLAISMMVSAFAPSAFADVPTLATADQAPSIINTSDSPDAIVPATNDSSSTIVAPTPTATPTEATPAEATPAEATPTEATPAEASSTDTTSAGVRDTYLDSIGAPQAPVGYQARSLTPRVTIPNSVISKFPDASLPVVNDINPADLTNWFVMDTTNNPSEANWNSTVNANKLHPYWPLMEQSYYLGDPTPFTDLTYDANAPGSGNAAFINNFFNQNLVGGSLTTNRDSNQHVIPTGSKNNATITFTGYGNQAYVNFALANVTTPKLKSATFDIFPQRVIPHAMDSYGIALNSRVETNAAGVSTFYGYYLMFHWNEQDYTSAPAQTFVYLVDFTQGFEMSGFQNLGDRFTQEVTRGTSRPFVNLGTIGSGDFRLNLDIENDKVGIKINYINPDGSLQPTAALDTVQALTDQYSLGNTAFGPMAAFSADRHGCSLSSVVQFNKLQLEIGYSLNFFRNDDSPNQDYVSFKGFDPGQSLNDKMSASPSDYYMPATPTRADYVFAGWFMEPGAVTPFNPAAGLTAITNVYAKWVPITAPTITINSDNTNWTNKDVTLTYDVKSTSAIGTVTSTKDADPTVTHHAGDAQSFTSPAGIIYGANGFLKVTAEGSYTDDVNPPGSFATNSSFLVNNIDKTAPLLDVTGVPIGKKLDDLTQVAANVKYSDIGDVNKKPSIPSVQTTNPDDSISGVDFTQSIFVLFDKKGTQVAHVPVDQINTINTSTLKGAYYYDVVIVDKAGNMIDSYGNVYDPTHLDPNNKKPGDIPQDNYNKKPNDPDHKVVINAGDPVLSIITPVASSNSNGYFDSKVSLEVKYEVESDLPIVDLEITGDDGVSIKIANPTPVPGSSFKYVGTFSSKQTPGVSSTVTYKGNATDDAGSVTNDSKTIKFDGVAPDITFTDSDLTTGSIKVSDTESGLNNSVIVITKKSTGKQETLTVPGSGDIDTLIKNKLESLGSGMYDINVTSTDNVTNQNQKSAEIYYEADKDMPKDPGTGTYKPKDENILNIIFTQNPANSIYTNKDVAVTYTITSEVRLKTISIDGGAAQDVSGIAPNSSGKYIYTGPVNVENNYTVDVTYVTYSRGKQLNATHGVTNIDRQEPGFGTNKFADDGSLVSAKGSTVQDLPDPARSANAISGIKTVTLTAVPQSGTSGAITTSAVATTTGTNTASLDAAIDDLISKKSLLINKYDVTITITDNAGNATKTTYKNMDLSNTSKPSNPGSTAGDWDVELISDGLPTFAQFSIVNKTNSAQKPNNITLVQKTGTAVTIPGASLTVTLFNGKYITSALPIYPGVTSLELTIDGDTVTIQVNTTPGPTGPTGPTTPTTPDISIPFTSGTTYTWLTFNNQYSNQGSWATSGATITKTEIRYYTNITTAKADVNGTAGIVKAAASLKNPPNTAKNVRVVVTYTKGGQTSTQVSDPFIIKG